MTATTTPLRADTLYLGDNGRAFCGTLRCAGMTAFASGRDLSGQPVVPITRPGEIREALAAGIACETCGRAPRLVAAA